MIRYPGMDPPTSPNLYVLDSDNATYSILYSCDRRARSKHLWLNSRTPNPGHDWVNKVMEKAARLVDLDKITFEPPQAQGPMCDYRHVTPRFTNFMNFLE